MEFSLNIKTELEHMQRRMLNGKLLDKLLKAYLMELKNSDEQISETEYREASKALAAALNEAEKNELRVLEGYGRDIVREGMLFAFPRGIYAGFLHLYAEKPPEYLFSDLITRTSSNIPTEMHCAQQVFNHQSEALDKMVCETRPNPETCKPLLYHLTSIGCAWEDRQYGVMRYAFYLGYRCALDIIRSVDSPLACSRLTARTLLLEHELAFTATLEEREKGKPLRKNHPFSRCDTFL